MNKEDNNSSPPSSAAEPSSSQELGRNGPIVQGAMVRDSTLKWCVPAEGSSDEGAIQIAEEIAATVPSSESQGLATPRPGLSQAEVQGALPEPIHGPLFEDSNNRPDSLEIMISEGTVQIETDPAALRQASRVSGAPVSDIADDAVTPPPQRSTTPMIVDPAWSAVTPPPKVDSTVVTPPPKVDSTVVTPPPKVDSSVAAPSQRMISTEGEPGASIQTPPPTPRTPPVANAADVVTPPPAKTPPVVKPADEDVVTPPPVVTGSQGTDSVDKPVADVAGAAESTMTPPPQTVQAAAAPEVLEQAPLAALTEAPPSFAEETIATQDGDEEVAENAAPAVVLPVSEMGATPEAPIRMAETAEVGEADFEVMEPLETSRDDISPTCSAPPPVPARPPAATSAEERPAEKKTDALPEALSRRPLKKNLKPWYEEVFDEDYLRTLPFMTAQQTLRETAFIKEVLSPPAEGEILDVACGYGRHAIEFGQRGFHVTGLDLSLPLLIRAADEAQRRGLSINFAHADMREMAYENQFDAAYCVLTSFGYFDEETNLRVASSICRALKPGGRFLVDTINRDYIVSDLPSRVWWEGDGCVVLEEVDFDFNTSRVMIRRSIVFGDGRQMEHDISIRAYSLHELGRILRRAGFQVLEVSGSLASRRPFLGSASRQVVLVCERPLT